MINHWLRTGRYPKEWENALLNLLYKQKGERSQPTFYRPINLTETGYRICESVVDERKRIRHDAAQRDEQGGFRLKRSTSDQLFLLTTAVERAMKSNTPLYMAALDIKKAFDSVDQDGCVYMLGKMGADAETCRAIRGLMHGHKSLIGGELEVKLEGGVLQGGILSPSLFNGFIDEIVQESSRKYGVHFSVGTCDDDSKLVIVMFADDTTLLSDSPEGLQKLLDEAFKWSQENGPEFHPGKCHIMRWAVKEEDEEEEPEFWLGDAKLRLSESGTDILGVHFQSGKRPTRNTKEKVRKKMDKFWPIIHEKSPFPSFVGTNLWRSTFSAMLLYASEVVGLQQDSDKIQRELARRILLAPFHTSEAAMFEFLGWSRVEKEAEYRLLCFANRVKHSNSEAVRRALQIQKKEKLPWFQRVIKVMEKWKLEYKDVFDEEKEEVSVDEEKEKKEEGRQKKDTEKQKEKQKEKKKENEKEEEEREKEEKEKEEKDKMSRYLKYKSLLKEKKKKMEVGHWQEKVMDVNKESIGDRGSSLFYGGSGFDAFAVFHFRYDFQQHAIRQKFSVGSKCPCCWVVDDNPVHLLFECDGREVPDPLPMFSRRAILVKVLEKVIPKDLKQDLAGKLHEQLDYVTGSIPQWKRKDWNVETSRVQKVFSFFFKLRRSMFRTHGEKCKYNLNNEVVEVRLKYKHSKKDIEGFIKESNNAKSLEELMDVLERAKVQEIRFGQWFSEARKRMTKEKRWNPAWKTFAQLKRNLKKDGDR